MFVLLSAVVELKVLVVRAKKKEKEEKEEEEREKERGKERKREVDSALPFKGNVFFKLFFSVFQEHLYDKNIIFLLEGSRRRNILYCRT